jgi:hypothetical protein
MLKKTINMKKKHEITERQMYNWARRETVR